MAVDSPGREVFMFYKKCAIEIFAGFIEHL